MMKFRFTYIFVLCIFYKICTAQIYFNNRYDTFGSCDGAAMLDTFNNQYLTAGFTCSSVSFYAMNLRLYNQNGVTNINKTYNWSGNNFQNGKGFVKDGNKYLLPGTRYYKNDTSLVFQWLFDTNLDSIKYTEYGYLNQGNVILKMIDYNHKNFFMAGYVYDNLYNSDILLIKTDTLGNEIWKKKIGLAGWDETAYCIKTCANGNLLVSGLKQFHGSSNQGPFIMRLDTSGIILWQNYYPSTTNANGSFDAMEMPNGDIVFTGGKGYAVTGNGTLRRPMLTKVDALGNLIWQKEYGEQAVGHDFFTFLVNEKNNFVISGEIFSSNNTASGMVYEINQNGDSLFSRKYRILANSQNYFRDIVQAPDKGYCFSGFVSPMNGDGGNQDIWLLKIDSTFCESAVSCGYPTSVRDINHELGEVSVYPNPANSIINLTDEQNQLQSETIVIKNYLGQIVFTAPFSSQIDISSLSSGMYFLTVQDKSNKRTVKVVKE
jgi:hypothetical protein